MVGEVDGRGQARRGLHGVFPDDERTGEGRGDAFLVAGVIDAGRVLIFRGEFEHEGGAGERINGPNRGGAGEQRDAGAAERGAQAAFEGVAGGHPGGLAGEPGHEVRLGRGGGDLRAIDMQPGAAAGGVQQKAGGGVGVVGDAGAVVQREGRGCGVRCGLQCGGVAVAGQDDGEAAGEQKRAQAEGEGERDVLFEGVVADAGAGIGAAVAGVEHDHVAVEAVDGVGRVLGGGLCRFCRRRRRGGQGMCRGCAGCRWRGRG